MSDISDFEQTAALPGASRDHFRAIIEAMPQLAWIAAANGTIEYFNRPWLEYTGLSIERTRSAGVKNAVHPDDLAATWARWNNALATGDPYEIQYRLRRAADSTYRWFIARALPIRDDDGCIVNWIGTATDIDAQVRANANLRFALEAAGSLSTLLDVRSVCDELARLAIRSIADWCYITLAGEDGAYRNVSLAHRDPERKPYLEDINSRYPIAEGTPIDNAVRKNVSTLIPRVDRDLLHTIAHQPEHLDALHGLAIHSVMVVPLVTDRGQTYGAITLVSSESAHSFTDEDRAVVEMVAHRAADAIQTARAYDEERRRFERMRFIAQATELIFESFDLHATFDRVTEFIVSQMADLAYIMLIEDGEALRTVSSAHRDPQKAQIARRMRGQRTLRPRAEERAIHMLASGETVIDSDVPDAVLPKMWDYLLPDAKSLGAHSAITIPLRLRGETFGALAVYWCESAATYRQDDVAGFEDLARRLSIAIDHARTLERERRIATSLQRALLPTPGMFPNVAGMTFDAEYRPSSNEADVGGDWYDAITLPDGSIAISVGDVTGRGLRAAGLMGKLRQATGMACLYETDPARLLDSVDFGLRTRRSSAIATAFVGIISPDRRMMRYASAGHPPPLLRRAGKIRELRSDGLPLGLRDIAKEHSKEVSLDGTDLLLLYTDGLTEGTRDLAYGERRLMTIASSQAILYVRNPSRFVCDACLPVSAQDDTAVLTVRFGEGAQWSFDAENAKAAHEARVELMDYLRTHSREKSDLEAAELVFGELVGNVVRHAPGPIDVQVDWNGAHPVLHVVDRGKGVVRNPSLPADPLSEGGRGLYIISLLTRSLRVERIPGYGNHIAAELRLRRS